MSVYIFPVISFIVTLLDGYQNYRALYWAVGLHQSYRKVYRDWRKIWALPFEDVLHIFNMLINSNIWKSFRNKAAQFFLIMNFMILADFK